MSWFKYGYSGKNEKRSHRKGVWLRLNAITSDVDKAIKNSKLMRPGDFIQWIEVKELRPKQQVLLEVWCLSIKDIQTKTKKWRYNVFHLLVNEDPQWICEGDLGRGHVGG